MCNKQDQNGKTRNPAVPGVFVASLRCGVRGAETLVCGSNIIFSSTSTLVGGVGSWKVDDVSAKMRGDKQTLSTQWTS